MPDTAERPPLNAGDYVKGYCPDHNHRVEGRVQSANGTVTVRSEDATHAGSIHVLPRTQCVLIERAQAVCHVCGDEARYRVVETTDGHWVYTPVCTVHRRAAKNMGHLTMHQDLIEGQS